MALWSIGSPAAPGRNSRPRLRASDLPQLAPPMIVEPKRQRPKTTTADASPCGAPNPSPACRAKVAGSRRAACPRRPPQTASCRHAIFEPARSARPRGGDAGHNPTIIAVRLSEPLPADQTPLRLSLKHAGLVDQRPRASAILNANASGPRPDASLGWPALRRPSWAAAAFPVMRS
jgi:hypothetical protein